VTFAQNKFARSNICCKDKFDLLEKKCPDVRNSSLSDNSSCCSAIQLTYSYDRDYRQIPSACDDNANICICHSVVWELRRNWTYFQSCLRRIGLEWQDVASVNDGLKHKVNKNIENAMSCSHTDNEIMCKT